MIASFVGHCSNLSVLGNVALYAEPRSTLSFHYHNPGNSSMEPSSSSGRDQVTERSGDKEGAQSGPRSRHSELQVWMLQEQLLITFT